MDYRLDLKERFDAYIFHRIVTPRFLPYLKSLPGKSVWETDDLLTDVPPENYLREHAEERELDPLPILPLDHFVRALSALGVLAEVSRDAGLAAPADRPGSACP